MAGRPTKLTPELLATLCKELKFGIPLKDAAGFVGIHRDTLDGWLQHGRHARAKLAEGADLTEREQLYLDASVEIDLARDYGAAWLVHQILDAAGGEKAHLKRWQAYMTILERTRPNDYRRRSSSEYIQTDKSSSPSRLDVSNLDLEERDTLRALLKKASGAE